MTPPTGGAPMMLAEAAALAGDVEPLLDAAAAQVPAALARTGVPVRVHLVGDGDSHHAGRAAEAAVEVIGGVACRAWPALPFVAHGARAVRLDARPALVVGVSASGRTPMVLEALRVAATAGAATLAVTGAADSDLARLADAAVVLDLGPRDPSPGIRTYQASLLGLLSLAVALGSTGGSATGPTGDGRAAARSDGLWVELRAVSAAVAATERWVAGPAVEAADILAGAPAAVVLGTGPALGAAMHAAAKLVEGCGLLAVAQDSEEWRHVERFAFPRDMPVVVLAPPGPGRARTVEIAEAAAALGRRVIVVAESGDPGGGVSGAELVVPVAGSSRAEFAPLTYGIFAAHVAHHVALRLGRSPFAAGRPLDRS